MLCAGLIITCHCLFHLPQASLNNDIIKPSYWLHDAVARGDLKVGWL